MDDNARPCVTPDISERKFSVRKLTCCVCCKNRNETPGLILFKFPSDENRYNKWFSALKWDVTPENLQYVLRNARICEKHFSDSCFTSTLRRRLIKYACPHIEENLPSTSNDILSAQASHLPEANNPSPTVTDPTHKSERLQVTPKTRKIKTLLSNVSKLKKRLYEKRTSSPFFCQLKAKLSNKPHLYEFVTSQLRMQCRTNKGRRWSAKEKAFALQIYLHSPSAYKILRKYFAFPSKATLYRYTYNVAKTSGFCPNLINCLKKKSSRLSETEKMCILLIDEMAIKQGLTYAADLDSVDGFTSVRNDLHEKPSYATQALVFMARGIVKNWKQVLGYFFTSPSDDFPLEKQVRQAIETLQTCGLEVVSIISDQGPNNKKLFSDLKVTSDEPFFWHNSKKIFAMYDPPHLLKSVRNNLKNHGIYFVDTLAGIEPRTCYASWKHIEKLYELDSKNKFSACRKLSKKHIEVCGLKKMNVKLAAQVLSHSVAAALNLHVAANNIESKGIETAEFLWKMDKLFDSVNSRTLYHEKRELCALTKDSFHISFWKEMIKWISTWHFRSRKSNRKIVVPCKNGWILTLNAFIGISECLFTKIKCILTNRFNQDALENTFSSVRRRGGFRENPDAYEFRHTIHKVIITNFLKQSTNKNCEDDDASTLIDFTSLNKKDLCELINENSEDLDEGKKQYEMDNLNVGTLNIVEENVLSYISGFLAKKFLSSLECVECRKLLVNDEKNLDNHTIFLYFKEYDMCKSGLKWPTVYLLQYFSKLHECFSGNFNLFFQRDGISEKFKTVLNQVAIEFFNNHLEHKDRAQSFFISSFIRMMIKHNIKKMNDEMVIYYSRKKLKKVLHV